jgi:CTP synthase
VPINFERDKLGEIILKTFGLKSRPRKGWLNVWKRFVLRRKTLKKKIRIVIVGKYFDTGDFVLSDSYISVIEAIKYSAYSLGAKPEIIWLNSKNFEKNPKSVKELWAYDGVIVPGGFGATGVEGKITAIRYAREHKIPYFGLCYGMQLAVIEFARHVANLKSADTTEISPKTQNPVIDIMPDQKKKLAEGNYGGSMRLGAYPTVLKKNTIARIAYELDKISERHRHRFEVNPKFIKKLTDAGLVFSGQSPDGKLMEIAELPRNKHPFFLGTQFHPEFKARPFNPHPLFTEFLKICLAKIKGRKK